MTYTIKVFLASLEMTVTATRVNVGVLTFLSPTRKATSNSDETRDLFNILLTKLNTLPSPLF